MITPERAQLSAALAQVVDGLVELVAAGVMSALGTKWLAGMTLAKYLALSGLVLDIVGVLVIGLLGERWMVQFWRSAPAQFDTQGHRLIYQGAWVARRCPGPC